MSLYPTLKDNCNIWGTKDICNIAITYFFLCIWCTWSKLVPQSKVSSNTAWGEEKAPKLNFPSQNERTTVQGISLSSRFVASSIRSFFPSMLKWYFSRWDSRHYTHAPKVATRHGRHFMCLYATTIWYSRQRRRRLPRWGIPRRKMRRHSCS